MSKLKELIAELCPNGVEFEQLSKVANMRRGTRVVKKQLSTDGIYPVFQNCLTPMGYYDKYNVKANTSFIICAGAAGEIGFSNIDFWAADDCFYFACNENLINRYLYHFLLTKQNYLYSKVRKASIPRLSRSFIETIQIPVPPLEIQREIVRILDSFTSLTAELQTKLQAELQARQKQYEYYRDQLLTFDVHGGGTSEVQWKTLGEVSDIISGFPFDSSQFTESGIRLMRGMNVKRGRLDFSESNNRYWSSYDGLEKYLLDVNDIVIAMDGSLVGKSFGVITKSQLPLLLVQRVARIRVTGANSRYVYHCVTNSFSSYVDSKKTEGAVPHISLKDISKFKIPTPPITIQNRIAEVLDNFDAICSDLNIGLPAEIEARQKQYEYYRDALLSFDCSHSINVERERELNKLRQYVFGYSLSRLGDIAINCDSQRKPITSGMRETGTIPYYGASGVIDHVKDYIFDGDYLLVSEDGANLTARVTPIAFSVSGKTWVNNHAHVLQFEDYETRRYVEIYLNSIDLTPYITGAAQPKLNQKNLNAIIIPLPEQEKRKKIVSILDRFETLCNDMTAGLPAEIEARQKQYEYYRDRLLSFPELTR